MKKRTGFALAVILSLGLGTARAEDWPTYRHDAGRSGVTAETLTLPLAPAWTHVPIRPPAPAWPAPAKADFWHHKRDLNPRVVYDRAFHVTVADGAVYYGSSADDRIVCLDAATGAVRWDFFTEGPVRLAPTVHDGRVYAGSDDGAVYCLDAGSGALRVAPPARGGRGPGPGQRGA